MHGKLTFQDPDGLTTTHVARVVLYGYHGEERFSWHGDLSRRVGQRGDLVTDDGCRYGVIVGNGLLEVDTATS